MITRTLDFHVLLNLKGFFKVFFFDGLLEETSCKARFNWEHLPVYICIIQLRRNECSKITLLLVHS